jgi:peroxiredoxin Q/BCP
MNKMALKIGDYCPLFSLPNQFGEQIHIQNFIGKRNLVIYFYPKDDTPGCTKEACTFRDRHEEFKDLGCEVTGISSDSPEKHQKFAEKHRLSFTLLSDSSNEVRKMFGVPTNLFGLLPGRVTYVIDKKGIIRGIYNSQTDPAGHIDKALEIVKRLD